MTEAELTEPRWSSQPHLLVGELGAVERDVMVGLTENEGQSVAWGIFGWVAPPKKKDGGHERELSLSRCRAEGACLRAIGARPGRLRFKAINPANISKGKHASIVKGSTYRKRRPADGSRP
jgi:hypothetical protein